MGIAAGEPPGLFVSDVVDNLNLTAPDAVYGNEPRGQPLYDPRMMTEVLVYGYCFGVFSSRRLTEDVGFRVLAAGNAPNFRTLADFRKLHLATLAGLFEEVLKITVEAGALKPWRVALVGHYQLSMLTFWGCLAIPRIINATTITRIAPALSACHQARPCQLR